jgi:hypothetical protein
VEDGGKGNEDGWGDGGWKDGENDRSGIKGMDGRVGQQGGSRGGMRDGGSEGRMECRNEGGRGRRPKPSTNSGIRKLASASCKPMSELDGTTSITLSALEQNAIAINDRSRTMSNNQTLDEPSASSKFQGRYA